MISREMWLDEQVIQFRFNDQKRVAGLAIGAVLSRIVKKISKAHR